MVTGLDRVQRVLTEEPSDASDTDVKDEVPQQLLQRAVAQ